MRISAYETLYESSIAYGIRKALMAEQKKMELQAGIADLKAAQSDLNSQVENLKKTIENTLARAQEKRVAEEKTHAEEVERIQKTNGQLRSTLESMLSAPKK